MEPLPPPHPDRPRGRRTNTVLGALVTAFAVLLAIFGLVMIAAFVFFLYAMNSYGSKK